MPLKRMRCPWISIVSPSMTDATPAIGAGVRPIQWDTFRSGAPSLCCTTNCVAKAANAATVTKTSRFGMLPKRRARRRCAPRRLRH